MKTNFSLKTIFSFFLVFLLSSSVYAESWDVSLWGKRRAFTEHVEKIKELVEEKTNGEFTLNISYGGLSKNSENLDGISVGAFEMAQFCAGYHEDKNPSITVLELPFLGVSDLEQEIKASQAVYQSDIAKRDLARWNATLLMPSPLPQYNVAGRGSAPQSLEQFRGFPLRATGGIGKTFMQIGASPVSMGAGEVYSAMESGAIGGAAFAPHAHLSFSVVDLADWWTTNLNPGTVNCPVVVNTDALNSLSDEHREALLGSVDEALEHYLEAYQVSVNRFNEMVEKRGIELVTFSDQDLASIKETAEPIRNEWIAKMNSQRIDGEALIEIVEEALR